MLTALLVVRLAEFWPPLGYLRPSIVGGLWAVFMLWSRSKPAARRAAVRDPSMRWTLAYCAAIAVTIPFSLWPGGAASLFRSLPLAVILMAAMLLCPPERQTLDRVLNWTVLCATVMAVLVSVTGAVKFDVLGGDRLGTTGMYDPNDLAAVSCVFMWLAVGMTMRVRGWWRIVALAGIVATLAVVLRTGSRGAIVALVVTTPVLLVALRARRLIPFVLALALAVPIAWRFGPESFRVRAMSLLHIEDDYTFNADVGRVNVWKRGLGYALERPIVGVGPMSYGVREGEFYRSRGTVGSWLTAHNTYIQVLVELGLVGMIPFAALMVGVVRDALLSWRQGRARSRDRLYRPEIFAALVSFMTSAIFLSHAYANALFFMLGLCALARRVVVAEGHAVARRS